MAASFPKSLLASVPACPPDRIRTFPVKRELGSGKLRNGLTKSVLVLSVLIVLGSVAGLIARARGFRMQTRQRNVANSESSRGENLIRVPAGGNLQQALDAAPCGSTLILAAGAVYEATGEEGFLFPAKTGTGCTGTAADTITVRTSNVEALPPAGQRVGISDTRNMSRLVTAGPYPAVSFAPLSKFWRLVGIEVTTIPKPEYTQFLVFVGTYIPTTKAPSDITFDRCYIHSLEDGTNNAHATARAGVDVEAKRVVFVGSRIAFPAGYAGPSKTSESNYAILMVAGPGPLTIENCFLSGWYTNFFMGGGNLWTDNTATVAPGATMTQARLSNTANMKPGDLIAFQTREGYYEVAKISSINDKVVNYIRWGGNTGQGLPLSAAPIANGSARWNGLNPGQVTIKRSTFYINPAIATQIATEIGQNPKGVFEIKSADGLLMDGNEFTGYPGNLALTVRNQTGPSGAPSPWSVIRNVTIRNNRYANMSRPYGAQLFVLLLEDNIGTSLAGGNILIENNLFTTGGWIADLAGGDNVTIQHNTFLNTGAGGWPDGRLLNGIITTTRVTLKDNIAYNNEYGMHCNPPYNRTWKGCWPDLQMRGNVLITGRLDPYRPNCSNPYPAGNACPSNEAAVGFIDAARGNFRLAAASQYLRKASDGSDPGVNVDVLEAALGKK